MLLLYSGKVVCMSAYTCTTTTVNNIPAHLFFIFRTVKKSNTIITQINSDLLIHLKSGNDWNKVKTGNSKSNLHNSLFAFISYLFSICCAISASTISSPVLCFSCSLEASLRPLLITQFISQVLHLSKSSLVTLPSR